MRWKIYWSILIGGLLALLVYKNWRQFRDKSKQWIITKSGLEFAGILAAAIYLPALLIAYVSIWITQPIKYMSVRIGISVIVGVILTLMSGFVLEGLVVLSVFAVELVSGDCIAYYRERRIKRGIRIVMSPERLDPIGE